MPFQLPKDGPTYTDHIITRSKDLIAHNIWQGLEEMQLNRWLNNFHTEKQRYFAAHILDNLMYRSEAQTKSMLTHLFQRTIPDVGRRHSLPSDLSSAFDRLQTTTEPNVRLVPVVPSQKSVMASMASGPLIVRLIRKHLRFRREWIIGHDQICHKTPFVVFIDDFIGTGTQFCRFFRDHGLTHLANNRRCCYVALAAHSLGIRTVTATYHGIPVSAVDLLQPHHGLFHHQSIAFQDGTNTVSEAKSFYRQMLNHFQITATRFRHGYGGLNLVYAFAHTVPNNSTPLLWWPSTNNWTPLFDR